MHVNKHVPSQVENFFCAFNFPSQARNQMHKSWSCFYLLCCLQDFETALHKVLSGCVEPFLTSKPHGFMSGRSTPTNLACFMEQVSAAVCESCQLEFVYCDLSAAFHVVGHGLLDKLLQLGINTPLVALLCRVLAIRFRFVSVNWKTSSTRRSFSHVPQ